MQAKRRDNPVKMVIIEVEGRSRGWPTMRWMDGIRRDVGEMGTLMDRIKSEVGRSGKGRGEGRGKGRGSGSGREGKVLQHMPGNHEKE